MDGKLVEARTSDLRSLLELAIAKVKTSDGNVAGVAFLATETLVVTCAHVVTMAGSASGQSVDIVFIGDDKQTIFKCNVIAKYWRDEKQGDIALLRLPTSAPDPIKPLPLSDNFSKRSKFSTIGCPPAGTIDFLYAEGLVYGSTSDNSFPRLDIDSERVSAGYSGAPVYVDDRRTVVGVLTTILPPDNTLRRNRVAFAIPSATLFALCPELISNDICPYKNLDHFTTDDHLNFFGRTELTTQLVSILQNGSTAIALLGPSGSGKSSVLNAGLLYRLKTNALSNSAKWSYFELRPGENPLTALLNAGVPDKALSSAPNFVAWLGSNGKTACFCIDQFEELFIQTPAHLRDTFVELLCAGLIAKRNIYLFISMRNDFYPDFIKHAGKLKEISGFELIDVPATLSGHELTSIIQDPARANGLTIEDTFVQRIVKEAIAAAPASNDSQSAECTVLPLLESALSALWENREGPFLNPDSFPTDGVASSLTLWATKAYGEFSTTDQAAIRRILLSLTTFSGDSQRAVKRVRKKAAILALLGSTGEAERLLYRLTSSRLVISRGDDVELIHDALIEKWTYLVHWIADDRIFLEWRSRTDNIANRWQASRKSERVSPALRKSDLIEAIKWLKQRPDDISSEVIHFIQYSCGVATRIKIVYGFVALLLLGLLSQSIIGQSQIISEKTKVIGKGYESQARALLTFRGDMAQVLAVEADNLAPSTHTEALLNEIKSRHSHLIRYLSGHASWLAFDSNGALFGLDLSAMAQDVADTVRGKPQHQPLQHLLLNTWAIRKSISVPVRLSTSLFLSGFAVNPSGTTFAFRDYENKFHGATVVADTKTGEIKRTFRTGLGGPPFDTAQWSDLAFMDNNTVLTDAPIIKGSGEENAISVMDVLTGRMTTTLGSSTVSSDGQGTVEFRNGEFVTTDLPCVRFARNTSVCKARAKEVRHLVCTSGGQASEVCSPNAVLYYSAYGRTIISRPASDSTVQLAAGFEYAKTSSSKPRLTSTARVALGDIDRSVHPNFALSRDGSVFVTLSEISALLSFPNKQFSSVFNENIDEANLIMVDNLPRKRVLFAHEAQDTPPDMAVAISNDSSQIAISSRTVTALYSVKINNNFLHLSGQELYKALCVSSGLTRTEIALLVGENSKCFQMLFR